MLAALMRYNLFWDNTPFCTLLYVDECCRGRGHGGALMRRWEADMKARGYGLLMTSTLADETAQLFIASWAIATWAACCSMCRAMSSP